MKIYRRHSDDFGFSYIITLETNDKHFGFLGADEYNQLVYKCFYSGYIGVETELQYM